MVNERVRMSDKNVRERMVFTVTLSARLNMARYSEAHSDQMAVSHLSPIGSHLLHGLMIAGGRSIFSLPVDRPKTTIGS